jgi:hypothetical protein
MRRAVVFLAAVAALPGCCIFWDKPGPPPDTFSLRTPEDTVESFRKALQQNDQSSEFRCLAQRFLEENSVGWGDYRMGRERFFAKNQDLVNVIQTAKITELRPIRADEELGVRLKLPASGPGAMLVRLEGTNRQNVELVLLNEPGYDVWVEGDPNPAEGAGPRPHEALLFEGDRGAELRYRLKAEDVGGSRRITEFRAADRWRFYGIVNASPEIQKRIEG